MRQRCLRWWGSPHSNLGSADNGPYLVVMKRAGIRVPTEVGMVDDPTTGAAGSGDRRGPMIIVVGVDRALADSVLTAAAGFAKDLGAELVCAHVDPERYETAERDDGSIESLPVDPDLPDDDDGRFDPSMADHIESVLASTGVRWTGRELAGDAARALARLADSLDAKMIVVGTRDATAKSSLREFLRGSVAMRLTHRQHRPVLVVPVSPVTDGGPLPWEYTRTPPRCR